MVQKSSTAGRNSLKGYVEKFYRDYITVLAALRAVLTTLIASLLYCSGAIVFTLNLFWNF